MKTITMPLEDYEREQKTIQSEAYSKGQADGHQSVWRTIKVVIDNPAAPVVFGEGFPGELIPVVHKFADWLTRFQKK